MLCDMYDLVGAAEIRQMLRVSRQRVSQLTTRPDFPAPVLELAMGKIWDREEVRKWARANGRELHEDATANPPRRRS